MGRNLLKIEINNKIEKRINFEECNLKNNNSNIITLFRSNKNILKFNQTYTKVRHYCRLIKGINNYFKSFMIESKIEDFGSVEAQLNLDLIWKSENGNRGHIQYSQIKPKLPPKGNISTYMRVIVTLPGVDVRIQ